MIPGTLMLLITLGRNLRIQCLPPAVPTLVNRVTALSCSQPHPRLGCSISHRTRVHTGLSMQEWFDFMFPFRIHPCLMRPQRGLLRRMLFCHLSHVSSYKTGCGLQGHRVSSLVGKGTKAHSGMMPGIKVLAAKVRHHLSAASRRLTVFWPKLHGYRVSPVRNTGPRNRVASHTFHKTEGGASVLPAVGVCSQGTHYGLCKCTLLLIALRRTHVCPRLPLG